MVLAGCANQPDDNYDANIRWTTHGIPHIKADNWGSLGYGFGYAMATDAVCVIAEEVITVNGERARFFGRKDDNVAKDTFHKALLNEAAVEKAHALYKQDDFALLDGYIAGYNRYLLTHEHTLPKSCNHQPWVRPITRTDVAKISIGVGIRYGLGRVINQITTARPPGSEIAALTPLPQITPDPEVIGSNAYGIGGNLTDSGRGILLGNPHYPWRGPSRFHLAHITIPGEVDMFGAGLYTTNSIALGFTRDIAWTHTVSTALRFTLFQLELDPDDAGTYRFDDATRQLTPVNVEITVKEEDGSLTTESGLIYTSHLGPVLASTDTPWTKANAFVIRDVNVENNRSSTQYRDMMRAKNVDELRQSLARYQAVSFVNTIAADRKGGAFYADMSAIPYVDTDLLKRCQIKLTSPGARRAIVLNGSQSSCEWKTAETAAAPGIIPPEQQPQLATRQYVSNSNDSHWLSNPSERLEGFSPIIGNEKSARSLRTRAGITFLNEVINDGKKFSRQTVQDIMYNHRNYGAELLLDDVLKICSGADDLKDACQILSDWDRRHDVDSYGAHLYTEFWTSLPGSLDLYQIPFDSADPINTPAGIKLNDKPVKEAVIKALRAAVKKFEDNNIPLHAAWGDVHYEEKNGQRIGIPGGSGRVGVFSAIYAGFSQGKGYTPIIAGNSFIQITTWDDKGNPDAYGILTYSQSQEADSPHYNDQTELYSSGKWIQFPFTDEEIEADLVRELRLTGS